MRKAKSKSINPRALTLAGAGFKEKSYLFPIKPPELMIGVIPPRRKSPIAMDTAAFNYCQQYGGGGFNGFPGYPYLAQLATRAEFRAFAAALSTELTREWIELNSSETAGDETKDKITELTKYFQELGVQQVIQLAADHDCMFGRAQIFMDLGQKRSDPLILSPKTIARDSLKRVVTVEPMWTSPSAYNALDPAAPDFYKPSRWYMLGQEVHASRLLTIVTRPVPDMLKPAFNFGGMSLSQLAEPYVDNWLRTRQSVSDLINNFSILALKTSMDQVLQGGEGPASDGTDLFKRAELFTLTRSNKGIMLLDKDKEELVMLNVPLGGLHELQGQAQEHMCSVSRMPAIILTGISPGGLNASSDSEIRVFYDWIAAQQEAYYRKPLEIILIVAQLSLYGVVDPDITLGFRPLFQMTPKELAEIRTANSTTAANLIDRGVIDPDEERERLARDPESGYEGLDLEKVREPQGTGESV